VNIDIDKYFDKADMSLSNINFYLWLKKELFMVTGNIYQCPPQGTHLKGILKSGKYKNILEIGFDIGNSAELFLSMGAEYVTSVDICDKWITEVMVQFMQRKYGSQFMFIKGNSLDIIPTIVDTYDLIFIDGAHDYNTAKNDLMNCKRLAHENTLVIMDDVTNINEKGARIAWDEAVRNGVVKQHRMVDYGIEYRPIGGKGMAYGKYIFGDEKHEM